MRIRQETKSEKSREALVESALRLFSTQGYRGTSIRELADAAGLSTGNLYHHFPDKEALFSAAMEQHLDEISRPGSPLHAAVTGGAFPGDLAALGRAAQETVRLQGRRMNILYVDAVEFDGFHLRAHYMGLAARFNALHILGDPFPDGGRPHDRDTGTAIMMVCRTYLHHHMAEVLFGALDQAGPDITELLRPAAKDAEAEGRTA